MTIALEIIAGIRALIEVKQLVDDMITKQAERAGMSQEELDELFKKTAAEVLARDPNLIRKV